MADGYADGIAKHMRGLQRSDPEQMRYSLGRCEDTGGSRLIKSGGGLDAQRLTSVGCSGMAEHMPGLRRSNPEQMLYDLQKCEDAGGLRSFKSGVHRDMRRVMSVQCSRNVPELCEDGGGGWSDSVANTPRGGLQM